MTLSGTDDGTNTRSAHLLRGTRRAPVPVIAAGRRLSAALSLRECDVYCVLPAMTFGRHVVANTPISSPTTVNLTHTSKHTSTLAFDLQCLKEI